MDEPRYAEWPGFWACFIDSYRYALGDFAVTEYDDPPGAIFWIVFLLGTLMSLLILLNMVIAVMGGAFEEVNSNEEAEICRSKLQQILDNFDRLPIGMVQQLSEYKYICVYEVEPESDPIGKLTHEERTEDTLDKISKTLAELQDEIKEMKADNTRNEIGADNEHDNE